MSVLEVIDGAVGAVPSVPRFLLARAAAVVTGSALVALALAWWFNRAVGAVVRANPTWADTDYFGEATTHFAPSGGETFSVAATEILIAVACSGFAATVLAGLFAPSVRAYVDAEPVDAEAVRTLLRGRTARLFGLAAVTTVPRLIPAGLFALLARAAAERPGESVGGGCFLVCLVCGPLCFWLTSLTAVAAPAAALEGAGFGAALRRSRRLSTRGRVRVGWTCLLTLLIAAAATGSLDLFDKELRSQFGVGAQFTAQPGSPGFSVWLLVYCLVFVLTLLLTTPLRAATATLLYVDRRFRREGLDIRIAWARLANAATRRPRQGAGS